MPHTCTPWNGAKGGVFAVIVANTLTLNDNIDVSEKGFKGGQKLNLTQHSCNMTEYYYPANNSGGNKGEGLPRIAPMSVLMLFAKTSKLWLGPQLGYPLALAPTETAKMMYYS